MKPKIIEEKALCMSEVKDFLSKIKKRDEELNFRANKTDEYISSVNVISLKKAKELKDKIISLEIPRLKEHHILKIIDTLPNTVDELKVVLQGYTVTVNSDNQKRIVGVISEFLN